MKGTNKTIEGLIKLGMTEEDIIAWLSENLTTKELTEQLAKTLKENYELKEEAPGMIRISQSDFNNHFRIIGFRSDGQPETRGRQKEA